MKPTAVLPWSTVLRKFDPASLLRNMISYIRGIQYCAWQITKNGRRDSATKGSDYAIIDPNNIHSKLHERRALMRPTWLSSRVGHLRKVSKIPGAAMHSWIFCATWQLCAISSGVQEQTRTSRPLEQIRQSDTRSCLKSAKQSLVEWESFKHRVANL